MAARNELENDDWATPRNASVKQSQQPLHDYYQPTPSQNDTLIELAVTAVGVVGVFCFVIALVKGLP